MANEKKDETPWQKRIKELKKQPIKYVWAYPLQSYYCRYVDLNKSKPYIDELTGKLENRNGLAFWKPAERHLTGLDDFLNQLENLELDEYVVNCSVCGLELITYFVEKNTIGREDGILGLKYTQHLMSYRPRADGLLGLECICGFGDTRLSTQEKIKYPDKFPELAPSTVADEAHFNTGKSIFKAVKQATAQVKRGKEV